MPLLLIGAGHVFRIEGPIQSLILQERPRVVALELDPARFQGLLQREAGTFDADAAVKNAPRIYRQLARFQEDIAGSYGSQVGAEMLAAARAARAAGSQLALIDRNAEETVRRLWSEMRFIEKLRLLGSSLLARLPWKRKASVEEEVAAYQKDPNGYLDQLGRTYPTLKRVLLDERNEHMARNLRTLVASHSHVVAVVGDGHVDGLAVLLKDLSPRLVRLQDLRAQVPPGLQWRVAPGGASVGFSFDGKSQEGLFRWR